MTEARLRPVLKMRRACRVHVVFLVGPKKFIEYGFEKL
jgi:hypothetical protein